MCLVLELLGPDLRSWQLCFGNPGLTGLSVKQVLSQVKNCSDCKGRFYSFSPKTFQKSSNIMTVKKQQWWQTQSEKHVTFSVIMNEQSKPTKCQESKYFYTFSFPLNNKKRQPHTRTQTSSIALLPPHKTHSIHTRHKQIKLGLGSSFHTHPLIWSKINPQWNMN